MHAHSTEAIEEAATEWVARVDRGLTRAEQGALAQWLSEDTRCREAFDLAQTTWKNLDRAQVFRIAAEESRAAEAQVTPTRHWTRFAYAAGVALVAAASLGIWFSYSHTHVTTAIGEIRQVPLDRKSVV